MKNNQGAKKVQYWLMVGLVMIFIQVMLGGITRLTGSGLSITEWDLILGAIPPLNAQQWHVAFEKYQEFPQYELVNAGMTLSEFKWIFFWEYFHRLWGRLLGVVFFFPLVYFLYKNYIPKKESLKYFGILLLGGAQGFMGWIMVQSGLQDMPWVDPAKLTAHLLLAMALFLLIFRLLLEISFGKERSIDFKAQYNFAIVIFILVVLQISIGGFMAGWKAAIPYPTWPTMNGAWLPENLFNLSPWYKNFFLNKTTIQFFHRGVAYLIFVFILIFTARGLNLNIGIDFRRSSILMSLLVFLQLILGIITIVNSRGSVPVVFGVLHQLTAFILLLSVYYTMYTLSHHIQKEKSN